MFNRYAIKNMHIEVLPRVEELYTYCMELVYFHEMVKRQYGLDIYCTYEYRNFKQDTINLNDMQNSEHGWLHDHEHSLAFMLIYKKTVIDTEGTDYRRVANAWGKDNRRYYWSPEHKSFLVFIEKKIEYGRHHYDFMEEIFDYTRFMINDDFRSEQWFQEFNFAWETDNQNLMAEWLKKNFPKSTDPRTYTDKLKAFFERSNEAVVARIQEDINSNIRAMKNYIDSYNRENHALNENRARLFVAQQKNENYDALIEAFDSMKNAQIEDVDSNNQTISFTIETELTSFDPDKMKALLNSDNAHVSWRNIDGEISNSDREKVLGAIFCEDPKYVLLVKQAFCMTPQFDISAERGYAVDDNHIANPHLNQFSCFGGNGMYIQQAFHDGDFAQGIALLTASVANVNLMEDISMKYMWVDLFRTRRYTKFIMNKTTGEMINVYELLEELKNPKAKEEEFVEEVKRVEIPVDVFNPEETPYDVQYTRRAAAEEAAAALGVRLAPVEEPAVDTDEDPIEVLRQMDRVQEDMDQGGYTDMEEPTEEMVEQTRRLIEQRRANQNIREAVADMNAALDGTTNNQVAVEYTEEEFDREFVPTFNQADRNEYRWRDTI